MNAGAWSTAEKGKERSLPNSAETPVGGRDLHSSCLPLLRRALRWIGLCKTERRIKEWTITR